MGQDILYKKKDCLGLDIGASSVKVVQLKKKKSLTKLVGYDSMILPDNLVIEGIVSDPVRLAKLIKEKMSSVKEGRFTAEKVIASIPDANVFTRVLELPSLSEKDLKEAVYWEADQSVPMALTDLVIDWQVLGPSVAKDGANDVLLVAVPLAIVRSYIQLFENMGLQPEAIEMSLASVTRALVSNKDKDDVMLVADMGAKTTNIGVYDNVLRLSDTVDVGGNVLTGDVSSCLSTDSQKAEKTKTESGLKDKRVMDCLKPSLVLLLQEMEKMIKYYDERFDKKPSKVLLCGGASNLPGITEYLAEALKVEVKIGNSWVNIDTYPIKPVPKSEAPAFANAIGLALRGMEGEIL